MSGHHEHAAHHDHGDSHHTDMHASHGSLKSYTTGFILALILTAIPFWLVLGKVSKSHPIRTDNQTFFNLGHLMAIQGCSWSVLGCR